jgi:hypothetical protein
LRRSCELEDVKERIPNPKETTGKFIDPLADLPPGSHGRKVKDSFEETEATSDGSPTLAEQIEEVIEQPASPKEERLTVKKPKRKAKKR